MHVNIIRIIVFAAVHFQQHDLGFAFRLIGVPLNGFPVFRVGIRYIFHRWLALILS